MQWTVAIGIDTHKDRHVAVALDRLGGQLDAFEAAATSLRSTSGRTSSVSLPSRSRERAATGLASLASCRLRAAPSTSASGRSGQSAGTARAT